MATILITYGLPDEGFRALHGHTILMPPPLTAYTKEEMLRLLPECDAMVAANAMDADMIRVAKKLKIIANYGAGYDSVDVAEAARHGIPVTNIPATVTESTAEAAYALMLAVARRVGEMTLRMRQEAPETLFGMGRFMGLNLKGMTLGILGAGRIGGRMAEMGKAFGMHAIGYSRRGADPAVMEPVSFDELIARSDVLSVHCPLNDASRGLINADVLARMKPGSILVNTARGAVVDSDALCDAVDSGHLFGAGLDVYPNEPHVPERLLTNPRIVLTPHVGSNTSQTRCIMAEACSEQILDVLAGKRPVNIVNGL